MAKPWWVFSGLFDAAERCDVFLIDYTESLRDDNFAFVENIRRERGQKNCPKNETGRLAQEPKDSSAASIPWVKSNPTAIAERCHRPYMLNTGKSDCPTVKKFVYDHI